MGAGYSSYRQIDDYIMDYIKHTYCTNPKCRNSPCVQHYSDQGPRGYICSECIKLYREQHEQMIIEAKVAREKGEVDLRKQYAAKVWKGDEWTTLEGTEEERVLLWDVGVALRKSKMEEGEKREEVKEVEGKGEERGNGSFDWKERFQGTFLPFSVNVEEEEWLLVEGKEKALNWWDDM